MKQKTSTKRDRSKTSRPTSKWTVTDTATTNSQSPRPVKDTASAMATADPASEITPQVLLAKTAELLQPLTGFSCSALESSVTKFRGDGSENPAAWLESFDRYATLKGWPADVTCQMFPLFLADAAYSWYQGLPIDIRGAVSTLRAAFLQQFALSPAQVFARLDRLNSVRQKPGQSVSDFLLAINRECQLLGRSTQQEMEHVIQGLAPEIKRQVLLQAPSSLAEVKRLAVLVESVHSGLPLTEKAKTTPTDITTDTSHTVASLQAELAAVRREVLSMSKDKPSATGSNISRRRGNQHRAQHGKSQCPKCGKVHGFAKCPAHRQTCNLCGKRNHFAAVCYSKQQRQTLPVQQPVTTAAGVSSVATE